MHIIKAYIGLIIFLFIWPCLCESQDSSISSFYYKGIEFGIGGNLEKAKEAFKKGLQIDPVDGPLKQSIIVIEDAMRHKIKVKTAIHLFKSADLANRGELDKSITEAKKAIALSPKYVPAYNNLGFSYIEKNLLEEALFYLKKAIEINPKYAETYVFMGILYFKKGQFDLAINHYNQALQIDPLNPGIYNNRAISYYMNKDFQNALKDIKKSEELGYKINPDFINAIKKALKELI